VRDKARAAIEEIALAPDESDRLVNQMKSNKIKLVTPAQAKKLGLAEAGEIAALAEELPKSFFRKNGLDLDQAAEQLRELGFNAETGNDAVNLINDDLRASRARGVYPTFTENASSDPAVKEATERVLGRLSKGLLPGPGKGGLLSNENLVDLGIIGAELVRLGYNTFKEWSRQMISRLGNQVKNALNKVWNDNKFELSKVPERSKAEPSDSAKEASQRVLSKISKAAVDPDQKPIEPTDPNEDTGDSSVSKSKGKGKFAIRVTNDERLEDEFNEENVPIEYEVESHQEVADEANEIINEEGTINKAFDRIKNATDITPAVSVAAQEILVLRANSFGSLKRKQAENATDPTEKKRLNDEADTWLDTGIDIANYTVEYGRSLGRGISAFQTWSKFSPTGFLRLAKKSLDKAQDVGKAQLKEPIDKIKKSLKDADKSAADKVSKTKDVVSAMLDIIQGSVDDKGNKVGPGKGGSRKGSSAAIKKKPDSEMSLWEQYMEFGAIKVLDNLVSGESKLRAPVQDFTDRATKFFSDKVNELIEKPEGSKSKKPDVFDKIKEIFSNKDKYLQFFNEIKEQAIQKFADNPDMLEQVESLFEKIDSSIITKNLIAEAIKSQAKALKVNFNELAKQKPDDYEVSRKAFRDSMEFKLKGLSESDMKSSLDIIMDEFDAIVAERAKKIAESKPKPKAKKPKKTSDGKSIWGQYSESAANRLLKNLKPTIEGKAKASPAIQDFTNRIVKTLRDNLPQGNKVSNESISDLELMKEAVKNWDKYQDVWAELQQQAYDQFSDDIDALTSLADLFGTIQVDPISGRVIQGAVKDEIKEMQLSLSDLVKQFVESRIKTREAFRKKVREKFNGLNDAEVDYLTDRVMDEYDSQVQSAREKALKGIIRNSENKKTRDVARKTLSKIDKLLELSNLGGITNQTVFEAVAEDFGFPSFTTEFARKISRLADEVQRAPVGFQKNNKAINLMNEISKEVGISRVQLLASIMYANMLSGFKTQQINIMMGLVNLISNFAAINITRPGNIPNSLKGLTAGFGMGMIEGANILMTGRSRLPQFSERLGADPVIELAEESGVKIFKGGKLNPLNYLKFVFRSLSAADATIRLAAQEMKAVTLARDIAKREGLSGNKLRERINELLFIGDNDIDVATQQAESEGLSGIDKKRRVSEIVESKRESSIVEDAWQFGGLVSFNHEPYGILGSISKAIDSFFKTNERNAEAQGQDKTKAFYSLSRIAIVPFTRIVGNVLNAAMDYTPAGYRHVLPGWKNEWLLSDNDIAAGLNFRSPDFRRDAFGRATLGTMVMAGFAGLALSFKDDEDPYFWIYGRGPKNSKDKSLLFETGWKPYTIKIGDDYYVFKESVFSLGLGMLGNYLDGMRFKDRSNADDGTLDRVAGAMAETGTAAFSMSFLTSSSKLFEILTGKAGDTKAEMTKLLARPAGSVIPFSSMFRQVDQIFDSSLYETNDIRSIILDQIPIARHQNKPRLNTFGKPIKTLKGDTLDKVFSRFKSRKVKDPVIDFIVNNGLSFRPPGKSTRLGNDQMTPEIYYDYLRISGPRIYKRILDDIKSGTYEGLDKENIQKMINAIQRSERNKVKSLLRKRIND